MLNSERHIRCVLNIGSHPYMRDMIWDPSDQTFNYLYIHRHNSIETHINVQVYEISETNIGHELIFRAEMPDGVIRPLAPGHTMLVTYSPPKDDDGGGGGGSSDDPKPPGIELTFDPDDLLKDLATRKPQMQDATTTIPSE